MYPHRIRLRGPWEFQSATTAGRVTLPAALGGAGNVTLRRRFGYPGRIDADERVYLVIEVPANPVMLALQGERLGECASSSEWDITHLLSPRNELAIETVAGPGEPWREVYLEVRRTAYLRRVEGTLEAGRLSAKGDLIGFAAGPLDLYLLAERGTVAYTSLMANAAGTSFELSGEVEAPVSEAKVELVCGAVVWYSCAFRVTADGFAEKER